MSYIPINTNVYSAAYAGAIAGMAVPGWITNPDSSNYKNVTIIAGAFAQSFDTIWNDATALNSLELAAITAIVQTDFNGRGPGPFNNPTYQSPSNWNSAAAACIALVLECDIYFANQGIDLITTTYTEKIYNSSIIVGANPTGVCWTPDMTKLYTANYLDNSVSMCVLATSTVTRLATGAFCYDVAMHPSGTFLYATNFGVSSISYINVATNAMHLIALEAGAAPYHIKFNKSGTSAFVACYGTSHLGVINVVQETVTYFSAGAHPVGVALSPDETVVAVTNESANTVTFVTLATGVTQTVNVGTYPVACIYSLDGTKLFCVCRNSDCIYVILTATLIGTATVYSIPTDDEPYDIDMTSDGTQVFVPCTGGNANTLCTINVQTEQVTSLFVGNTPYGCTVSPDQSLVAVTQNNSNSVAFVTLKKMSHPVKLFVVNYGGSSVTVLAPQTGKRLTADLTGTATSESCIYDQKQWLYLGNETTGVVQRINVLTLATEATTIALPAGSQPINGCFDYGGNIWFADYLHARVLQISTSTGLYVGAIAVGTHPKNVILSGEGHLVVPNNNDATVSIISQATGTVTSTVSVVTGPNSGALDDFGNMWILGSTQISILKLSNMTVSATISAVVTGGQAICNDEAGGMWVAGYSSGNIQRFIAATQTADGSPIAVGTQPYSIVPDGLGNVVVANFVSNTVVQVNIATKTIVATLPTGSQPACITPVSVVT